MNFKTLKTLAMVGTAAISIGLLSHSVNAADNATMNAKLSTSSIITVTAGNHMDFGTWLIGVPAAAPSSTLIIPAAAVDPAVINKTAGTGVQLIQLTGTPAYGTINVTLPTGANAVTLQMTQAPIVSALGTGLTLTSLNYFNPNTPLQTGTLVASTPVPITITTGATGVAVKFGATITATATPTNGIHTNTVNVAFAY